jgi:hypothetical protein
MAIVNSSDTDTTSGRISAVIGNLPFRSLKRAGVDLHVFVEVVPFDSTYELRLEVIKGDTKECAKSNIRSIDLFRSPVNLEEAIQQELTNVASCISPFVHEWDPRIGSSITFHHGVVRYENWPYCPLFDRKDKEDLVMFSKFKSGHTEGMICPVCKKDLVWSQNPHQVLAWAGGNLCWVHDWCNGNNFTGL